MSLSSSSSPQINIGRVCRQNHASHLLSLSQIKNLLKLGRDMLNQNHASHSLSLSPINILLQRWQGHATNLSLNLKSLSSSPQIHLAGTLRSALSSLSCSSLSQTKILLTLGTGTCRQAFSSVETKRPSSLSTAS